MVVRFNQSCMDHIVYGSYGASYMKPFVNLEQ